MILALPEDWLDRLRATASRPPARPRLPLAWRGQVIGSVEPALVQALHAAAPATSGLLSVPAPGTAVVAGDDLTVTLAAIACALRDAGLAHAWRDEQLAVQAQGGAVLGTVERGVVRPLGIATRAVHLIGLTADGRHWVQQRSYTKPNDPGLWDTLVGGMVPASDTVDEALARETWEEAGLRLPDLQGLVLGGQLLSQGPSPDGPHGYTVERLDWYRCVLPDGLEPSNQDGEVEQFRLMSSLELREGLLAHAFTIEAGLIYAAASSA